MASPDEPFYMELATFEDERGWFAVTWVGAREADPTESLPGFVQENLSRSRRGVVRGMHYQLPPHAQAKLVRVCRGRAFDAVVDVRRSSATFGRWWGFHLDADTPHHLLVPVGFAHGFLSLQDGTELQYKVTAPYAPDSERSIRWDDPSIGIDWPLGDVVPTLSSKDAAAPPLSAAEVFE
jgi:dTDP-4-dehydrorhamnose 3,5-epimerase